MNSSFSKIYVRSYFAPRAINFAYYAGIMLDALAHLYIMLKIMLA